jgi:transposase
LHACPGQAGRVVLHIDVGAYHPRWHRDGIEVVTLESTSGYWRIWFFVLEACGLAVQLVNASQARNLPGRPRRTGWMRCGWPG